VRYSFRAVVIIRNTNSSHRLRIKTSCTENYLRIVYGLPIGFIGLGLFNMTARERPAALRLHVYGFVPVLLRFSGHHSPFTEWDT